MLVALVDMVQIMDMRKDDSHSLRAGPVGSACPSQTRYNAFLYALPLMQPPAEWLPGACLASVRLPFRQGTPLARADHRLTTHQGPL